jgi:hypothetical protein
MSLVLYVAVSHECDMIQVKIKYRLNLSVKTTSEFLKNTAAIVGWPTQSQGCTARNASLASHFPQEDWVVEPVGVEPTTSCLQSRRSTN